MLFSFECPRVPVKEGKRSLTNLVKENILLEKIPQIHKKKLKTFHLGNCYKEDGRLRHKRSDENYII